MLRITASRQWDAGSGYGCDAGIIQPFAGVTTATSATTCRTTSLSPDQPPPAALAKPKLTAEERRARQADRLTTIRLRMVIDRELEDRGIRTPAQIGAAIGMPAAEAFRLLRGHQWRVGQAAQLEAAAVRLVVAVPPRPDIDVLLRPLRRT